MHRKLKGSIKESENSNVHVYWFSTDKNM